MEEANNSRNIAQMADLEAQFDKMLADFQVIHVEDIPDIDLYMDQVLTFLNERLASSSRDPANDKILTKTMINNYARNSNLMIPPVNKKYGKEHMILLLLIYYMKSFLSIGDIEEILRPLRENYTDAGRQAKKKAEEEARKRAQKAEEEARRRAQKAEEEARKRAQKAEEEARRHGQGVNEESRKHGQQETTAPLTKPRDDRAGMEASGQVSSEQPSSLQPLAETTGEHPGEPNPVELEDIYRRITDGVARELSQIGKEAREDFDKAAASFSDFPADDQPALQKFDLICRLSMEIYLRKLFIERMIDHDKNGNNDRRET